MQKNTIMTGLYFKETQKVNLGWKWIMFISLYILLIWALFEQFKNEIDISAVASIIFSISLIVIFNIIVVVMKLDTEISIAKISFRYKPFHIKPRVIYWDELSEFYLRNYKPVREFGGHGIQRRLKTGRAFTVSGKKGLQLLLKDGKKILIGTNKPRELEMVIVKLKTK